MSDKELDKVVELLEVIVSKRDKKYSEIEHLPFNCDIAQEALVELNTFIENNGWQDIESAPDNSTDILVRNGYNTSIASKRGNGYYMTINKELVYDDPSDGGRCRMAVNPTHWMPLPSIKSIKE